MKREWQKTIEALSEALSLAMQFVPCESDDPFEKRDIKRIYALVKKSKRFEGLAWAQFKNTPK